MLRGSNCFPFSPTLLCFSPVSYCFSTSSLFSVTLMVKLFLPQDLNTSYSFCLKLSLPLFASSTSTHPLELSIIQSSSKRTFHKWLNKYWEVQRGTMQNSGPQGACNIARMIYSEYMQSSWYKTANKLRDLSA